MQLLPLLALAVATPFARFAAQECCLRTAVPAAPAAPTALEGTVMDAATDRPLAGVSVAVHAPGDWTTTVLTDTLGRYRVQGLPAGRYVVRLHAIGYRPAAVTVELESAAAHQVSVGMRVVHPVRLQPVHVLTAAGGGGYGRTASAAASTMRELAEERRRVSALDVDSRVLTEADVREAVPLAEPDLFRTLQRLPGVGARDDYTAALWTRGAPWDQTQVTFDGVPLFNALHAVGLVSAVNTDALGGVAFHPGVQPTEHAGGAAALVRLESRAGDHEGRPRALAELSLLSARVALDQSVAGGRLAYMVAARRSHLDLVPPALGVMRGAGGERLPYAFDDVVTRLDARLPRGARLEMSAIGTRDRLWGEVPGLVLGTAAEWGGLAARATLVTPLLGGVARHTVGVSRFDADMRVGGAYALLPGFERLGCGCFQAIDEGYVGQPMDNAIAYAALGSAWTRGGTAAGVRLVRQEARFRTAGTWPHARRPQGDARLEDAQRHAVAWAEREWRRGGLAVRPGLRVEAGDPVQGGGRVRVAPRASARWAPSPRAGLTAGASRTYQYAQAIAPPGGGRNAVATADLFWLVAGRDVPAARSDFASVGAELMPDAWTTLTATAYRRATRGVALADLAPGPLAGRALFAAGSNLASGVELSARRVAGRWTGGASFTAGASEIVAGGQRYAAPWEHRRVLRAHTAYAARGTRLVAQYAAASGAPFTRYFAGQPYCAPNGALPNTPAGSAVAGEAHDAGCYWSFPPMAGAPSGRRAGGYRSLDLAADWQGGPRGRYGAFAQMRNVLRHVNGVTYLDTDAACVRTAPCDPSRGVWGRTEDTFLRGLPATVAAGARMTF